MTDIEAKALALVNEIEREEGENELTRRIMRGLIMDEALCRAIEQHEAFKQEVSDAVKDLANDNPVHLAEYLAIRFSTLIDPKPKPDPLVEVLLDMELSHDQEQGQHDARYLRAKLEARGLEIREKGQ
jgi:hypothetical protein